MALLMVNINDKKDKKALKALKAIIEAFDLNYGMKKDNEVEEYDPGFVTKIKKSQSDYEAGKGVKITLDDIWK